jgi:uncharacterized membrane protein
VFTRISIIVAAALMIVLGAGAATANAATQQQGAQQQDCTVVFFDVGLSQGIEAFCDSAPGTYQVIARCTNDVDAWQVVGTLSEAGAGPSVAVCRGLLLFPAQVFDYFVVQ